MGSRWAVVLRCGLSKPSSQESRGGSYGSVNSVACVPCLVVRAFFVPARRIGGMGELWKEETVFLMVYRVLDVVREFFLGEGVPDWAARGVTDRGERANVAYLEAAAVSLHARR